MHYPPAQPLPFVGSGADQTLLTGAAVLVGWSFTETAAADAQVDVYDGPSASGRNIAFVTLSAGQSTRDLWAPNGIEIVQSLTVNASTGAVSGTLFAVPGEVVDAFLIAQGLQPIWGGGE